MLPLYRGMSLPGAEIRPLEITLGTRRWRGSLHVLAQGATRRVVGNRHLGYHAKLRRLFGAADVVASTPKFVLLRATRDRA